MQERIAAELEESARLQGWAAQNLAPLIQKAAKTLLEAYGAGGKVLLCGNGGSAAQCQHMAAELVGRYRRDRPALPAIALTTDTSVLSALGNDLGYEAVFARQVEALIAPQDVLIAISTSGHSPNLDRAAQAARKKGAKVIALLGGDGGSLAALAHIPLILPSFETPRVQECQTTIGHILCGIVEEVLFGAPPQQG